MRLSLVFFGLFASASAATLRGTQRTGPDRTDPRFAAMRKHRFTPAKDLRFSNTMLQDYPNTRIFDTSTTSNCSGNSTIQFADPTWYGTNARMTAAFAHFACKGATRQLHWHTDGDEWALVTKGRFAVSMPAPTAFNPRFPATRQVPWSHGVDYSIATEGSTWYFPEGWWHAFTCETDECELLLFFNSPPAKTPGLQSLDLAHALDGMPMHFAADVMAMSETQYNDAIVPHLQDKEYLEAGYAVGQNGGGCGTAQTTCPVPSYGITPQASEPSVAHFKRDGNPRSFDFVRRHNGVRCGSSSMRINPNAAGGVAWDLTASFGLPFLRHSSLAGNGGSAGRGMSGQVVELMCGGSRPPVWTTNADAILYVVEGSITLWIYPGRSATYGVRPQQSRDGAGGGVGDNQETIKLSLAANELAYIPKSALYYFEEATDCSCQQPIDASGANAAPAAAKPVASVTVAFNHPEWEETDMKSSLAKVPEHMTASSVNLPRPTVLPSID